MDEVAKYIEDYGDTNIVKDSMSSAYVEFKYIYGRRDNVYNIVKEINEKEKKKEKEEVKAYLYKDAIKYKAGPALNTVDISFAKADCSKFNGID